MKGSIHLHEISPFTLKKYEKITQIQWRKIEKMNRFKSETSLSYMMYENMWDKIIFCIHPYLIIFISLICLMFFFLVKNLSHVYHLKPKTRTTLNRMISIMIMMRRYKTVTFVLYHTYIGFPKYRDCYNIVRYRVMMIWQCVRFDVGQVFGVRTDSYMCHDIGYAGMGLFSSPQRRTCFCTLFLGFGNYSPYFQSKYFDS